MAMIKVKVLNGQQIQFPDGHVETRSASPRKAPPQEGLVWHAALARWIPEELNDKGEFEAEYEVSDGEDDAKPAFDGKAFAKYLKEGK